MSGTETLRRDLAQSAAALGSQPLLVAITVGLALAPMLLVGLLGLLAIPLVFFEAGFVGTQRIWFLRAFRGTVLRTEEVWPLTLAFVGRMVVLACVVFTAVVVVLIPIALVTGLPMPTRPGEVPGSWLLLTVIAVLIVDVGLTFVVPALSYTTGSVREALRQGLRMIRDTWPGSALYVLTPGIAASALAVAVPPTVLGSGGRAILAVAGAVLALWFKGAIAALYLRLHPETGDEGAARLSRHP